MSIAQPGTRIGRYEIVGPLGEGGMGEVFRAHDSGLGRDVAIKLLFETRHADAEMLQRFEQEARAAAALHHANILTVYDIGWIDGRPYFVSELLEGSTLREHLGGHALPPRRAIEWASQIARGLAAAHAAGIVHRDLKPENVFITKHGVVKLLDFGVAKLLAPVPASDSPTLRVQTEPGTVIGTVSYMSPEQVRGTGADARSDVFSFGTLLYELLTGERPFDRHGYADTMSAILRDEPRSISEVSPAVHAALEGTVMRCLEKAPAERFQSAADLAYHLESIEMFGPRLGSGPVRAATIPTFQQLTFRRGRVTAARFANDGRSVVYAAAWEDQSPEIFVTLPGVPEARALGIRGSVHAVSANGELAVSLDHRTEVGFAARGTLARVSLMGGTPRQIVEHVYEADWSPDGSQLAICRRSPDGSGYQAEFPIGNVVYRSGSWLSHLRFSPHGDRLAMLEHPIPGDNRGRAIVVNRRGGVEQHTEEYPIMWGLAWHPRTEELWYSATSGDGGRPAQVTALTSGGATRPVFAGLGGVIIHDIAPDGAVLLDELASRRRLVAHLAAEPKERDLSWLDWSYPVRLSQHLSHVLFEEQGAASGGRPAIYLRPLDGSAAVRLDHGRARDLSGDGRTVLAVGSHPDRLMLLPTGPGEARDVATPGIEHIIGATFGGNESSIIFGGAKTGEGTRLYEVPIGGGEPRALSREGVGFYFVVSDDGRRVAAVFGADAVTIVDVASGEEAPVPGAEPGDLPALWRGEELIVWRHSAEAGAIHRIDLTSGTRTLLREFTPPDPAGVDDIFPIVVGSDGESYVYGYRIVTSELFVGRDLG